MYQCRQNRLSLIHALLSLHLYHHHCPCTRLHPVPSGVLLWLWIHTGWCQAMIFLLSDFPRRFITNTRLCDPHLKLLVLSFAGIHRSVHPSPPGQSQLYAVSVVPTLRVRSLAQLPVEPTTSGGTHNFRWNPPLPVEPTTSGGTHNFRWNPQLPVEPTTSGGTHYFRWNPQLPVEPTTSGGTHNFRWNPQLPVAVCGTDF